MQNLKKVDCVFFIKTFKELENCMYNKNSKKNLEMKMEPLKKWRENAKNTKFEKIRNAKKQTNNWKTYENLRKFEKPHLTIWGLFSPNFHFLQKCEKCQKCFFSIYFFRVPGFFFNGPIQPETAKIRVDLIFDVGLAKKI